jgi:MoxR-like ATPase
MTGRTGTAGLTTDEAVARDIESVTGKLAAVRSEISKAIVGQSEVVEGVLTTLLAGGHVLLEGVPGLGKTLLVRTLSHVIALSHSRIQFTPDLMPADVIGTSVLQEGEHGRKSLDFQPGPVFANLLLADEINRATPRTQSALLEAMQEKQVTVAGTTHVLQEPFVVMATQNPLEMEGTYPLPEAQLDRFFFKLLVPFPSRAELNEILDRTTREEDGLPGHVLNREEILAIRHLVRMVPLAPHVREYAVHLVWSTHPEANDNALSRKYIRYGSSPRGAQALILGAKVRALLDGRFNVSKEDVRAMLLPALRHRILLNFEAQADSRTADDLLEEIAGTTTTR